MSVFACFPSSADVIGMDWTALGEQLYEQPVVAKQLEEAISK